MKNFVFTSAGDNTNFHNLWISKNMNYDIYAIYYGDNEDKYEEYKSVVTFIEKRKGSKFQNFYYFYNKYPEIINKYERFFILDDDIIISCENINNIFNLSKQYNFDICQPSFNKTSKISHRITTSINKYLFRYTNFVEVNTPLFSRQALDNLMKLYDPILIGWGIDYLAIYANGIDKKQNYAIIDSIDCINPHENTKNGKRELSLIEGCNKRANVWREFAKKIGCPTGYRLVNYSMVKKL